MYIFQYFNQIHITMLLLCGFIGYFLLELPRFSQGDRRKVARNLGLLILATVIYESYHRVSFEYFSWGQVAPLHFCSVSVVAAGLYLWRQKDEFFQITYYFSFGAVLAMILPGISRYEGQQFFILFMVTHAFVFLAAGYGLRWLGARPTLAGLKLAWKVALILFAISFIWNEKFFTNFMFTKIYLLPVLDFIQPFWIYQVLLIPAFGLAMYLMYLPFRK